MTNDRPKQAPVAAELVALYKSILTEREYKKLRQAAKAIAAEEACSVMRQAYAKMAANQDAAEEMRQIQALSDEINKPPDDAGQRLLDAIRAALVFSDPVPSTSWKPEWENGVFWRFFFAQAGIRRVKYHPAAAMPKPVTRDPAVEERDAWIYAECFKGTIYKQIIDKLRMKPKDWPRIANVGGIKAAANRYAKRRDKPPIPKRQHGRPH
jgi:hypothetical protein